MSSSGDTAAAKANIGQPSSPATGQGAQRRDSHSTGYAGLVNQKRGSLDEVARARRESFNDQKPASGMIGNLWNSFTQGHNKSGK